MVMMDDYRKGWALRYIREAEDELKASKKATYPSSLMMDAARKAQAAVYYSLGDAASVENLVNEAVDNAEGMENPVLRCLVEIERTLQQLEKMPESANDEVFKETDEIVRIAAGIVNILTSED
jgi:hypothetical protein